MNGVVASQPACVTFEQALLRGEATGYAVCAKPLRFAGLPDAIATSFAEIGFENCYFVFEREADAAGWMARIRPEERLGQVLSIRSVRYIPNWTMRDGPRFDATGHPFEMRGFVVDRSGAITEWTHAGRLGWCDARIVG